MKHILIVSIFIAIAFVVLSTTGVFAKRRVRPTPTPGDVVCMDSTGKSGPCPTIDPTMTY